ncbi:hypothetical protein TNCV_2281231 [Trichonephila clavipes]|nr:hypothetical protein TNCV_2281231 [Trichonephila clavipes]
MLRLTRPAPPGTAASPEKCAVGADGPLQEKRLIVIRVMSPRVTGRKSGTLPRDLYRGAQRFIGFQFSVFFFWKDGSIRKIVSLLRRVEVRQEAVIGGKEVWFTVFILFTLVQTAEKRIGGGNAVTEIG